MTVDPTSDPKSWENYFKDIIRVHYQPANYNDVPDKHAGDFGIECYTLNGHVFQCYLPEQVADVGKLVDAQKSKIRKDIKKFTVDNVSELTTLFGDLKISRWILATPVHDSAVLAQYCSTKSLKVREMGLPYVAPDFQIMLHTAKDYPQEVKLLAQQIYQLSLSFDEVSQEKAANWIDENIEFLANLDLKIPKITPDTSKIEQRRAFIVQKYLEYQNLLDSLREDWGDIYETIYSCIDRRERFLEGRFMVSLETQPPKVINEEITALRSEIQEEISTLKGVHLNIITWGVIADWLIRCPLDF